MSEILRLEGLEVHFRVGGGLLDSIARRPAASCGPSTGST